MQPYSYLVTSRTTLLALALLNLIVIETVVQPHPALAQPNTWRVLPGSPYYDEVSSAIVRSGIDNNTAQAVQNAAGFERSNWATGSVFADTFYILPNNASTAVSNDVLKVERAIQAASRQAPWPMSRDMDH